MNQAQDIMTTIPAEQRKEIDEGFARAMRHRNGTSTTNPRWVLEKTWHLNPSMSKNLTVGYCLERQLQPLVTIQNPAGLGIKMNKNELLTLLDAKWRELVLNHLKNPCPGERRVFGDFECKCMTLNTGEPGLRLAKVGEKEMFCVLGGITVKNLFDMTPAILERLDMLVCARDLCVTFLVGLLGALRARIRADTPVSQPHHVMPYIKDFAKERDSIRIVPPCHDVVRMCDEVNSDMLYRHADVTSRMLTDFLVL